MIMKYLFTADNFFRGFKIIVYSIYISVAIFSTGLFLWLTLDNAHAVYTFFLSVLTFVLFVILTFLPIR